MIKKVKLTKDIEESDRQIFDEMVFTGVMPSPEDTRDFTPAMVTAETKEFPEEYESPETEIFNQGSIGSCVAHSCSTALSKGEELKYKKHKEYSRGYIYGNRAALDFQGEGMYMRQALKQLNKCGDVYYEDFPYNKNYQEVKKLIAKEKNVLAQKAAPHAIVNYYRCYSEMDIKDAIFNRGGCLICVPVYTDFARNLARTKTNVLRGYHAMIIVGWTKEGQWIVQNSWGKLWGYDGKLLMNKDYPVDEYWGINVNANIDLNDNIDPTPVDNIFVKIVRAIGNFFKNLCTPKAKKSENKE